MKGAVIIGFCGALGLAGTAQATNLVQNGSFESGLTGWTTTGSGSPGVGAVIAPTDGVTAGIFGDIVPIDPFTFSPDPTGTHGAYFYDDSAHDTLSQSIFVTAGQTYEVGFDLFKTASGAVNPEPFTITGSFGSDIVTTATSASLPTAEWQHFSSTIMAATTGNIDFNFVFDVLPGIGQDVIVDKVYAGVPVTPAAVPEPASLAVLGAGLLGLSLLRRRKTALARPREE